MGFTVSKQTEIQSHLFADSDIINYHFDDGVPWTSILHDDMIPSGILNGWILRKVATKPGHKIYLSMSPLAPTKNKLAFDNSNEENAIPVADSLSFASESIKAGYLTYCKEIINHFRPAFFNFSSEANLFFYSHPEAWTEFIDFHRYIYEELKSTYPELIIFTSVAVEPALEDLIPGADHVMQRLPILQLLDYSDLFAVSIHPGSVALIAGSKLKSPFAEAFNISKKPFALSIVADYPWIATCVERESFNMEVDVYTAFEDVLGACLRRNAVFVVSSARNVDHTLPRDLSPEITTDLWRKYWSVDFN
jgi:hypothetical protein